MPDRSIGVPEEGGSPLERALETFAERAGARIAVLLTRSGMLLAQKGVASRGEVMQIAALAAGIHAAGARIGAQLGDPEITQLHNSGERWQLLLNEYRTPVQPLLLLSVVDVDAPRETVRPAYEELGTALAGLPGWSEARVGEGGDLEEVLLKSLDRLFPEP